MLSKKSVPLSVWQAIEPVYTSIDTTKFVVVKSGEVIFRVEDIDSENNFYFEVHKWEIQDDKAVLHFRHAPRNANIIGEHVSACQLTGLPDSYKHWATIIEGYQKVVTPMDDPILEQYEEEFYAKFESADDDAMTTGFTLEQQFLLDEAMTKVIHLLEGRKDEKNKAEIEALVEEAEKIQASITVSTKVEVLTKLSKFFAKVQKGSLKWIKDVYPIIQGEIIKGIVKATLELPS